jgi:hypothetical protein
MAYFINRNVVANLFPMIPPLAPARFHNAEGIVLEAFQYSI